MKSKLIKLFFVIAALLIFSPTGYANISWVLTREYQMPPSRSFEIIVLTTILIEYVVIRILLQFKVLASLLAVILCNLASYLAGPLIVSPLQARNWSFELLNLAYLPATFYPQILFTAFLILLGSILVEIAVFFCFCRLKQYLVNEMTRMPLVRCIVTFVIGNFASMLVGILILLGEIMYGPDMQQNRMLANEVKAGLFMTYPPPYWIQPDGCFNPKFFFHLNPDKTFGICDGYCFKIYPYTHGYSHSIIYAWPLIAGRSGRLVLCQPGYSFCTNLKNDGSYLWSGIDNPPPHDAAFCDSNGVNPVEDFQTPGSEHISKSGQIWFSGYWMSGVSTSLDISLIHRFLNRKKK